MRRTVKVVSKEAQSRRLREGDTLTGGPVLPDFSCNVAEIFERIARDL